jgi:hypothetical protein
MQGYFTIEKSNVIDYNYIIKEKMMIISIDAFDNIQIPIHGNSKPTTKEVP